MGFLQRLKFYSKSFIYGFLLMICALYGVVASILLRIVGKEEYAQYTVARAFYFLVSKVLGITITIKNARYLREKPAVVVLNHQSALDVFVLGELFKPGYTVTAKKALKYVPFLGWFMLASNTFFLDRARGEKARKVLDRALLGLKKQNRSIFMFPEGTRSSTKKLDMLPFKKGAFHLARQAAIPVIPVVVSNYSHIFHSGDMVFNRGNILIEVLPPMPTTDVKLSEDVNEFAAELRSKMSDTLENLGYAPTRSEMGILAGVVAEDVDNLSDHSEVSVEVITEDTPLVSGD